MDKKQLVIKQSYDKLNGLLDHSQEALPSEFNKARFVQNCTAVWESIKDIELIDPQSIARTMLKGAFLGLDFFNKECYAIPRNKKVGNNFVKHMSFQTDYKGEIKLAKKYAINNVIDIYAKVVKEGDEFSQSIEDGKQLITYKPKPFNDGKIIGAFAVAKMADGALKCEEMSASDIERVKDGFAKVDKKTGAYSKAWTVTREEMYKKTVLRRLCKGITLDFDSTEQRLAWDEGSDMDMNKKIEHKPMSSLDAQDQKTIDAPHENVEDLEEK